MDKMSIFNLMTVTVPEIFLDLFIGFLLIGERKLFQITKNNIIKFILAIGLMSITSLCIRTFIPIKIGLLTVLIHMFVYVPIIKYIFNISYKKSVLSVTLFVLVLLTIEALYLAPVIAIILKTFEKIFHNDMIRLLCSIPERILQVAFILYLSKLHVVKINVNKYDKFSKECNLVIYPLLVLELAMLFDIVNSKNIPSLVLHTVLMGILVFVNAMLFKLITRFTEEINLRELSSKNNYNIIDMVHYFLNRNDLDKAKELTKKVVNR